MSLRICMLALLACTASPPSCAAERAQKPAPLLPPGARIAVVAANSTGGSQVDRVVGDMLTTALRKAGVRVLERQEIDAVLREQRLGREGVLEPATAAAAGKVTGAEYLLAVKATEFGVKDDRIGGAIALGPVAGLQIRTSTARVVLDVRLLDATTGGVVLADTAEGKQVSHGGTLVGGRIAHGAIDLGGIDIGSKEWSESSLGKASRKAVDALLKRMVRAGATMGRVLAVLKDGGLIVGLGAADGVREGDRLEVVRVDPVTDSKGDVVWTEERPVGLIRLVEVRTDRSRAIAAETGIRVEEGDRVKTRERTSGGS